MSFAIEKLLVPVTGHPMRPIGKEADQKLNIAVSSMLVESMLAALKEAGNLANSLGARIKRSGDRKQKPGGDERAGHEVFFKETE
jgi:hypothetical protein